MQAWNGIKDPECCIPQKKRVSHLVSFHVMLIGIIIAEWSSVLVRVHALFCSMDLMQAAILVGQQVPKTRLLPAPKPAVGAKKPAWP